MADPFVIPPEMKAKYEAQFVKLNPVSGMITGEQARGLFLQSGLPGAVLAHIWTLADVDADGKMDITEFSIAFHLIALKLRGVEPPPTLPPCLRALVQASPFEAFKSPQAALPYASQPQVMVAKSVGPPGGRPPPPHAAPGPGRPPPPTASAPPSQPGSRSGSIVPVGEWAVPPPARRKFGEQFTMVDSGRTGFVTGVQARGILMQSGLPQAALAQIWNLSDVNSDGKLTPEEFILAMFLIERTRAGMQLPPVLPPELVPPAFRLGIPQPVMQQQQPPPVHHAGPPRPAMPAQPVAVAPEQQMSRSASTGSRGYSAPSSGASTPGQVADWSIPQVERMRFTQQFNAIDTSRAGFVSGAQARNVLVQSALPQQLLAQIWNLSDVDTDGKLTVEEFILAMHFVEKARGGQPLPSVLPPDLVPPSMRRKATGSLTGGDDGGSASATPPSMMLTEWAIPQQSKLKYTQTFNSHDRTRSGFLSGNQARGILMQSGLPTDLLAQVWNLSDIDSAGRLTCEEFVLAMHLIDMVRNGDTIPASLPPDLVPPSHRRKRSVVGAAVSANVPTVVAVDVGSSEEPGSPKRKVSITTFEDKRKENFDKGQAILDRKRQALLDQQRREQDERERKEREEQAKREKVRLEMERKRQEELERQRQKQLEIEAEKEEARKKQLEQREAARREMERQRMLEWETQRTQELLIQKQKVLEALTQLKSKKNSLVLEVEQVNNSYNQWKEQAKEGRDKVTAKKAEIDGMRSERDTLMKSMNATNVQLRTLNEKQIYVEQEKLRIAQALKNLAAQTATEAGVSGDSAQFALQNKQMLINQLKSQLEEVEKEKEHKKKDLEASTQQLNELKASFEKDNLIATGLQESYDQVLKKAAVAKDALYQKLFVTVDSNADWEHAPDDSGPASIIVSSNSSAATAATGGQAQYHALYAFESRNADELSLEPGDIITLIPGHVGEPGWLEGALNGKTGWFPEAYVELYSADGSVAPAAEEDAFPESAKALETVAEAPENGFEQQSFAGAVSRALAIYPWKGTENIHLSFNKNDIIIVKEQQSEWWQGEANGRSGWFPNSYVKLIADAGEVELEEWYMSVYPFESVEPGDLAFQTDELMRVTKKEGEWWTGEISSDRIGVFPSNYVRDATPEELPKPSSVVEPSTPAPGSTHASLGRKESTGTDGPCSPAPFDSSARATDSPSKSKQKAGKLKKPEIVQVVASYKATGQEQLSLEKGQLIQVRKKNSSGWWEGEVQVKGKKRQVGWFPATYVKSLSGGTGSGGSSARSTPDHAAKMVESEASKVITIYPFKAQHDDEISFEANEIIKVLSKDDPTWWKGQLVASGAIGLFPSNHVQEHKSSLSIEHSFEQTPSSHRLQLTQNGNGHSSPTVESLPSPTTDHSNGYDLEVKRQQRIQELIATEEAYVDGLEILISVFKEPLFSSKALSATEVEAIFVNVDQLYATNKKFLKALKRRRRESVQSLSKLQGIESIGDIIAHNLAKMDQVYIKFCSRQLNASKLIQKKTEENGYFSDMAKRCAQDPRCKGFIMSSFLLKPTQRVTKYPDLVQKIADKTPLDHEDHANMRTACDWAQYLCNRVNEGTRLHENAERLEWVQKHVSVDTTFFEQSLTFNSETNFLGPREILHTGCLTKVNSGKDLVAFLFTDFLLLTLPNKEIDKVPNLFASDRALGVYYKMYKFYFLDRIELIQAASSAATGSSANSSASSSPSVDNQLSSDPSVFVVNRKQEKAVTLFRALSINDRSLWVSKLGTAIRVFCDSQKNKVQTSVGRKAPAIDASSSTGRLLVTVLEGVQFPSANNVLNAYFIASVGLANVEQGSHLQLERAKEIRGECLSTTPSELGDPNAKKLFVARFNHSMKFYLSNSRDQFNEDSEEYLVISCFDRNPFAPDVLIGRCLISVKELDGELSNQTFRPLSKCVKLETPANKASNKLNPVLYLKLDVHWFKDLSGQE